VASHSPSGATVPAEADAKFAAIALGGKQHKVTEGDVLIVDRVPSAEVGTEFNVPEVLLVGSRSHTIVGRPLVPSAIVKLDVEQQTYAGKVVVFKKNRRKGYKRFGTFRRPITVFRVKEIVCDMQAFDPPPVPAASAVAAAAAAEAPSTASERR
jgi:large subunit ribosomal protein L21